MRRYEKLDNFNPQHKNNYDFNKNNLSLSIFIRKKSKKESKIFRSFKKKEYLWVIFVIRK